MKTPSRLSDRCWTVGWPIGIIQHCLLWGFQCNLWCLLGKEGTSLLLLLSVQLQPEPLPYDAFLCCCNPALIASCRPALPPSQASMSASLRTARLEAGRRTQ